MTSPSALSRDAVADVLVVGDGLVGLCSALAAADAGLRVLLVGDARPGQASAAAAGMLAPGVERAEGPAHRFAIRSRDVYPEFVARLEERGGVAVPLNREGVLQAALDDADAGRLAALAGGESRWLPAAELARLEPALAHALGALLHPRDGAVDNRLLLRALDRAIAAHAGVRRHAGRVERLDWQPDGAVVATAGTGTLAAGHVVVATGAWLPSLAGLPRALPVEPVRGQMLAVAATPLGRVVYGPGGYLVPRADRTLAGSTMEHVGFDHATTAAGVAGVRAVAERICPALAGAPELERWAGLRPVTPDGLPVLGRDPARPSLLWAVGHSRNGVLMAPFTGACVAALLVGAEPPADLSPFAATRFDDGAAEPR